jgi:hypothetical protein
MKSQRNINANGDVALGNIDKSKTTIYNVKKTRLGGIIEQLRDQIGEDPEAAEFVECLIAWMNPKRTELKRDLAAKLNACGKGYLLEDALVAKELFAKQLRRTSFNPALQEVYAYMLGQVQVTFNYRIKPLIASAAAPGRIEASIADLAEEITSQIADAPPELGIGLPEVIGMLYFLTGNCHIDWDYNAPVPSGD